VTWVDLWPTVSLMSCSGTPVGGLRKKREARRAAARVFGVTEISNELQVRLLDDSKRKDADLRGHVYGVLAEIDAMGLELFEVRQLEPDPGSPETDGEHP
jgi:hypothetical protein